MSADEEFATVDLVLASCAETRGVDGFALALIKAERQMRKLVTYLVFQSPAFTCNDIEELQAALRARKIFFGHFLEAWDELSPRSLRDLVGAEHDRLRHSLDEVRGLRNKIFHGQVTGQDPRGFDCLHWRHQDVVPSPRIRSERRSGLRRIRPECPVGVLSKGVRPEPPWPTPTSHDRAPGLRRVSSGTGEEAPRGCMDSTVTDEKPDVLALMSGAAVAFLSGIPRDRLLVIRGARQGPSGGFRNTLSADSGYLDPSVLARHFLVTGVAPVSEFLDAARLEG